MGQLFNGEIIALSVGLERLVVFQNGIKYDIISLKNVKTL